MSFVSRSLHAPLKGMIGKEATGSNTKLMICSHSTGMHWNHIQDNAKDTGMHWNHILDHAKDTVLTSIGTTSKTMPKIL